MTDETEELHPAKAIRRFDIFAEYTRQERVEKGDPEDVAKGYAIWLAKFVANKSRDEENDTTAPENAPYSDPKWRWLNGEIQTDFEFDIHVLQRMGPEFYERIFMPAISAARAEGKKYEDVRDSIRETWKPAKKRKR